MSDTSHDRADRHDRPDEVTDPLLWGLALDVADAHQPDQGGADCVNLLCAGHGWPCAAWENAQRALQMAQASPEQRPATAPADRSDDALTGWSPVPARQLRPAAPAPASRTGAAA
ncbi:hypothetical protein ACN26Y_21155 [Micromonospora sp. WMMD558]|uniref:hypothetical protein n=1 Tax=unclassified Micromonospora TaxID=2617518 RepID=UPI001E4FEA5D|nr:hypothetical protein [Micromonospora sp. WMMC415]